jgi:hypothetical protein
MDVFIHWCGFIGAWLLVAGPLYQAAIELMEDAEQADDIQQSMRDAPVVEQVSRLWWLFPPAYFLLRRRASKRQQAALFRALTPDQRRRFLTFVNKAGGWMTVAAGAFLIALKETWELTEVSHWPAWVFWALAVVLAIASIGNAAVRVSRGNDILKAFDDGETQPG